MRYNKQAVNIRDKGFKNGPGKICERQLIEYLQWYGLFKKLQLIQQT